MSDKKSADSNKNILLLAAAVAVIVLAGAFIYNSQKKETVSISLGDKTFSASIEQ